MQGRVRELYDLRTSQGWRYRIWRVIQPPQPFLANPAERHEFPLGRWNLYIGGAGCRTDGYLNVDLSPAPGVTVAADAEQLPFPPDLFVRVECDAVLEHVRWPEQVMREIERVLAPGGYAHVVTPFCHPFHAYPEDFRRFTLDGLKLMAGNLEVVDDGWRTGPTATLILFTLEYFKLLLPWRPWRAAVHFVLGWLLAPFRYLDRFLMRTARAGQIGNTCYLWLRKPDRPAGGTVC